MAGAVLLDLDGVLYVEDRVVDGAREAVEGMREAGLALRFVTNTTSRSRVATLEKLRRLGFELDDEELVTPAALAVSHCLEHGLRRVALLMEDEVKRDFAALEEDGEHAQAVIVGDLGERFGYATLNAAFRLLMDGAELIALQKNRYWLREDGLSLDVGPFVAALEYATGRAAYVVGKPAPGFFREVLAGLGLACRRRGHGRRRRRNRHRRRAGGGPGRRVRPDGQVPRGRRPGRRSRADRRRSTRSPTCSGYC